MNRIKKLKSIAKIIYTAGVIIDDTYNKVVNDKNWANKYVDHMTIQFGGLTEKPSYIGDEFNFIATHVVEDEKGKAWIGHVENNLVILTKMQELGQHAHITLFTADGVKPVYSNELIQKVDPIELEEPITVKMQAKMFVAYEDGMTGWEV